VEISRSGGSKIQNRFKTELLQLFVICGLILYCTLLCRFYHYLRSVFPDMKPSLTNDMCRSFSSSMLSMV